MTVDTKALKNHNSESSELSEMSPAQMEASPGGTPAEDASWFASTDTVRLQLGEGRWVEIKEELTYREKGRLRGAGVGYGAAGEVLSHDPGEWGLAKIKMWLVGWNARDRNGPIPLTAAAIDELSDDQGEEILDAIRAHEAALAARKNPSGTVTRS